MVKRVDHSGHRQRLKDRYLAEGIDHFQIHNVLELLLFFGIPYRDTNEIAHRLIDTFGSLDGVLDAPVKELAKVSGVGENTAILIHLVRDIQRVSSLEKNTTAVSIKSSEDAVAYFKNYFSSLTVEYLALLCLDNSGKIITCSTVAKGTVNYSSINTRKVIETILQNNSASVIFGHNHPKGKGKPSPDDVEFTVEIKNILRAMNISVRDHIIIGENNEYSMADDEIYDLMFS